VVRFPATSIPQPKKELARVRSLSPTAPDRPGHLRRDARPCPSPAKALRMILVLSALPSGTHVFDFSSTATGVDDLRSHPSPPLAPNRRLPRAAAGARALPSLQGLLSSWGAATRDSVTAVSAVERDPHVPPPASSSTTGPLTPRGPLYSTAGPGRHGEKSRRRRVEVPSVVRVARSTAGPGRHGVRHIGEEQDAAEESRRWGPGKSS
jgi:hypothetical protein